MEIKFKMKQEKCPTHKVKYEWITIRTKKYIICPVCIEEAL